MKTVVTHPHKRRRKPVVVTHPGSAHLDEFLSCCLLIAADKVGRGIERRVLFDGSRAGDVEGDLNDPNVIVLDQGGRHEPELLNFDHHQFDRDAAPECSITLILPYLGIDVEKARSIWGWLEFSELLDSKGPFATAEKLGSNPEALFAGVSPIETTVLRWFEGHGEISSSCGLNPLWDLMYRIGKEKLDYLNEVVERHKVLDKWARVHRLYHRPGIMVKGLVVVDATVIKRDKNPVMGLESWIQTNEALEEEGETVAVTVTQDDRGDGLSLFRRNDDPRIDFSLLEGKEGVVFAHKGGFVAKLAAGVDWKPCVVKSIVRHTHTDDV